MGRPRKSEDDVHKRISPRRNAVYAARARFGRWAVASGLALALLAGMIGAGVALAGDASADPLSVTFRQSSVWNGGYVGTYTLKNTGTAAVNGWTLEFDLPAGDSITSLWNGVYTVSGNHYTVHDDGWNHTMNAGQSTDFGFSVQGSGENPINCTVNSRTCGAMSPPPSATTTTSTRQPPTSTSVATTTMPPTTNTTTGSTTTTASPPSNSPATFGAFAPYTDLSLFPLYDLAGAAQATGNKYFNLAFVIDGGGCTPKWGGVTGINDTSIASDISRLRAAGGDVRVSFGGANGTELAQACPTPSALASAYQSVINATGAKHVDFDIEGAAISDPASIDRRNQAISMLERSASSAGRTLEVSYTLPVLPSGLTQDGTNLLQNAKTNGAAVSAVNIMAMDYGSSFPPDMGQNAIDAAAAVQEIVKSVWGLTDSAAWQRVAVTPMIGVNDVNTETFTLSNASALVSFAQSKHLAWLSFWSGGRDRQCSGGAQNFAQPTCSSIVQQPNAFAKTFSSYKG